MNYLNLQNCVRAIFKSYFVVVNIAATVEEIVIADAGKKMATILKQRIAALDSDDFF